MDTTYIIRDNGKENEPENMFTGNLPYTYIYVYINIYIHI